MYKRVSISPDYALAQAGFIQVFVIGGLVTIAGVLTLMLSLADDGVQSEAALERLIQGKLIVDAAFGQFVDGVGTGSLSFTDAQQTISGQFTSWTLEAEGGKISMLGAPIEIVAAYANIIGVVASDQRTLIAGLNQARAQNDAEAALATLDLILGPDVPSGQLEHDFSTVSRVPTIDLTMASPSVLAAIPDVTEFERSSILATRGRGEPPANGLSVHFGNPTPQYLFVVTVRWSEMEHFSRRIPFELTAGGQILQLGAARP